MKSAIVYTVHESPDVIGSIDALPRWESEKAEALSNGAHVGLMPISSEDDFDTRIGNDAVWLRFRVSFKKLPASAVAEMKRQVRKKHKRGAEANNAIDARMLRMLLRAPASHADIDVVTSHERIVVGTNNINNATAITGSIRQTLGSFKIQPFYGARAFSEVPESLLAADGLSVDNIELGRKITADFGEDGKINVNGQLLRSRPDLVHLLQEANRIPSAQITWRDMSATLRDDWTLSSIQSDMDLIHGTTEYENGTLRRAAEMYYYYTQLPRFLCDIALHAGGLEHEATA